MDFESPDVERDFPGLYPSKRNNDSDFSDDSHEKISKKDLLIGKRKDKKDSKKDKGYSTLEGESSPDEESEVKSPSKSKKSKPFKFSTKKEKREKSRDKEKELKEKETEKEKEKEKKKEKVKIKVKDKKKIKQSDDSLLEIEDSAIFGVPLSVAVERDKCYDGVDIPLLVRLCIDYVQENGILAENVYKISGIKSRVQHVKRLYNQRDVVLLSDFDLPVVTSLFKQYLRELPEPILTTELLQQFENYANSSSIMELKTFIDTLPSCNKTLLTWLITHFHNITLQEKINKMNAQSIASALSSEMQMSAKLLTFMINNISELFPSIVLKKYVPPQTSSNFCLPDTMEDIASELKKQESLLEHLHAEINRGIVNKIKEEQLWEVQRIITQLKRKLRILEKQSGNFGQRNDADLDDTDISLKPEDELNLNIKKIISVELTQMALKETCPKLNTIHTTETENVTTANNNEKLFLQHCEEVLLHSITEKKCDNTETHSTVNFKYTMPVTMESLEVETINRPTIENKEKEQLSVIETEALISQIELLRSFIDTERQQVNKLREKMQALIGTSDTRFLISDSSDDETEKISTATENNPLQERKRKLKNETKQLRKQKEELFKNICEEFDACVSLKVRLALKGKRNRTN